MLERYEGSVDLGRFVELAAKATSHGLGLSVGPSMCVSCGAEAGWEVCVVAITVGELLASGDTPAEAVARAFVPWTSTSRRHELRSSTTAPGFGGSRR